MMNKGKKVMVGMSGGVDSSVAAYLLKEQGYEVVGVTMKLSPNFDDEQTALEGGCCSLSAVEDARRVASQLDIPYYVLNFQEVFEKTVIDYFAEEYLKGRTPNPCIACNKYVKFEAMLDKAKAMGIDYVATGHYAKIVQENGRTLIKKSKTVTKDQTYALYNLTQAQLSHILMPLGDYTKEEVREIAQKIDLSTAFKRDSQEICFVPDQDYARFIQEKTGVNPKKGKFIDTEGNVLGEHQGLIHYTVGQRKGLGVAFGKPMYVIALDVEKNQVILGESGKEYSPALLASELNFIPFDSLDAPKRFGVKVRYSTKESMATVEPMEDGKVKVTFDIPQRAVTPGQAVVFYDEDILVGGGTIEKALSI